MERFGKQFFREVPRRPGVYLLCGAAPGVLYVGKAKNLQQRLGQYRSANSERVSGKTLRLLVAVERIYWDECRDESEAIARERDLLLVLRPRFNTVGVYPAPKYHLGLQEMSEGLWIGLGDATEGWERRYGEFARLRSVYAALLRLIWWTRYPEASLSNLPLPLLRSAPPAVWFFTKTNRATCDLAELAHRLDEFFRGASPELADWLAKTPPPTASFERQWKEQDALQLREFYARLTTAQTREQNQ